MADLVKPLGEKRLIPPHDDAQFQCWRFIDEYGDTVFSRQRAEDGM